MLEYTYFVFYSVNLRVTAQKLRTTLSRDTNRVACYVILVAHYAIPVAQDAILVVRDGLKTVSIMSKILERFNQSMVKLCRD